MYKKTLFLSILAGLMLTGCTAFDCCMPKVIQVDENTVTVGGLTDDVSTPVIYVDCPMSWTVLDVPAGFAAVISGSTLTFKTTVDNTVAPVTFKAKVMAANGDYVFVTVTQDVGLYVCEIDNAGVTTKYGALATALDEVLAGETLRLLRSITYNDGISLDFDLTLDLDGYDLNVLNEAASGIGLEVDGATLTLVSGGGEFNVTGEEYGVYVSNGGVATVTNAVGTGDSSPIACGAFATDTDSKLEVTGDAKSTGATGYGAYAINGGYIKAGSATATALGGIAVRAGDTGSKVEITGDAVGVLVGAYAYAEGVVEVNGTAKGTGTVSEGVNASTGGYIKAGYAIGTLSGVHVIGATTVVEVTGDVTGDIGVDASDGAQVTIDGEILGSSQYVLLQSVLFSFGDNEAVSTKPLYREYTDGTSTVWVML